MEFTRSHHELIERGVRATRRDTRESNRMILFLESSSMLWEATKFIAEVRDRFKLTDDLFAATASDDLSDIFNCCANNNNPSKDNPTLRTLHKIRHNASSHVTESIANYAVDCKFDNIKTEPLLRSRDGGGMTTTFPLCMRAAMLYCFQNCGDDKAIDNHLGDVIRIGGKIYKILNIIQDELGQSFRDCLDTTHAHVKF